MVICKEIDYYLKYAEEHPNWINKKRKLLFENIVKPLMKRDDVFFDEKTYRNCIKCTIFLVLFGHHSDLP